MTPHCSKTKKKGFLKHGCKDLRDLSLPIFSILLCASLYLSLCDWPLLHTMLPLITGPLNLLFLLLQMSFPSLHLLTPTSSPLSQPQGASSKSFMIRSSLHLSALIALGPSPFCTSCKIPILRLLAWSFS